MTAPISSEAAASGSAIDSRSLDATKGSVGSATMSSVTRFRWTRSIEVRDASFMALEDTAESRLDGLHCACVDLGGSRLGDVYRFHDILERHILAVIPLVT